LTNPETTLTFSSKMSNEADKEWFAPISYVILNKVFKSADPAGRGQRGVEAIHRGELALLMEKLEFNELAESEWKRAAKLHHNYDVEKMKSFVDYLRKNVDDELVKKAEDTLLGPDTSMQ
jgi:hypothetical protein